MTGMTEPDFHYSMIFQFSLFFLCFNRTMLYIVLCSRLSHAFSSALWVCDVAYNEWWRWHRRQSCPTFVQNKRLA